MGLGLGHRLAVLALLGAAGCHSASATPMDAGAADATTQPSTEAAMRASYIAYMTKYCTAFMMCDPTYFQVFWGDTLADCVQADAPFADILEFYGGYGSTATADRWRACADALDLSTCDAYVRQNYELIVPDACRRLAFGTLPNDSPCAYNSQCAGGACFPPTGSGPNACGVCLAQKPNGARCQFYFECQPGASCQGPPMNQTCTPFGTEGANCDAYTPCQYNLLCVAGQCTAPVDTCDPMIGCPVAPQFRYCDRTTMHCEVTQPGLLTAPCGPAQNNSGWAPCKYGGTCTKIRGSRTIDAGPDADAGRVPAQFACEPLLDEGQACDPGEHPWDNPCKVGVCFNQVCQRNGAAQCTAPPVPP